MNVDSKAGWVKRQLRGLSAVEPPTGLRERLRAAVPCRAAPAMPGWRARRWPGAAGWTGIAAAIVVIGGVVWLGLPPGPAAGPSADANGGAGRVLAADYNSTRPADINALDMNGIGPTRHY